MPTRYEIDPEGRFVTAFYIGRVTQKEFREMFFAYMQDPLFELARPHLVDISEMTGAEHGFAELQADFRMLEGPYRAEDILLRIAIFGGGDMAYGMTRMFLGVSAASEVIEAKYFDTRDEAVAWVLEPRSAKLNPGRETG